MRYNSFIPRKGYKMIATGQLLSTLSLMVVLSIAETETTVSGLLLSSDDNFLKMVRSADTIDEVIDWVNENY